MAKLPIQPKDTGKVSRIKINKSFFDLEKYVEENSPHIVGGEWYIGSTPTGIQANGLKTYFRKEGGFLQAKNEGGDWYDVVSIDELKGADGQTVIGVSGSTGAAGPMGPQGPRGEKGAAGMNGVAGPRGTAGPAGQTGAQGKQGSPGSSGPKGAKGEPGSTGSEGPKGDKGSSITGIKRVSGNGQAGSEDVYEITTNDGTNVKFKIYNGKDADPYLYMAKDDYTTNGGLIRWEMIDGAPDLSNYVDMEYLQTYVYNKSDVDKLISESGSAIDEDTIRLIIAKEISGLLDFKAPLVNGKVPAENLPPQQGGGVSEARVLELIAQNSTPGDITPSKQFIFDKVSQSVLGGSIITPGTLVIPSKIDGLDVLYVGPGAFKGKGLSYVELPNTLLKIGVEAFANNNLQSINIPNNTNEIKSKAFTGNNGIVTGVRPSGAEGIVVAADAGIKVGDTANPVVQSIFTFDVSSRTITGYNKSLGGVNVTIPNTLEGVPVENIGNGVFSSMSLTAVSLPPELKYIGNAAFERNSIKFDFSRLKSQEVAVGVNAFLNSYNRDTPLVFPKNFKTMTGFKSDNYNAKIGTVALPGVTSLGFLVRSRYTADGNLSIGPNLKRITNKLFGSEGDSNTGMFVNFADFSNVEYVAEKALCQIRLTVPITISNKIKAFPSRCFNVKSGEGTVDFSPQVTSLGEKALENLQIKNNINISKITSFGQACFKNTNARIKNQTVSISAAGSESFQSCIFDQSEIKALAPMVFRGLKFENNCSMSGKIAKIGGLTIGTGSLVIKSDITLTIEEGTFRNSTMNQLIITAPEIIIGKEAFRGSNIGTFRLNGKIKYIGEGAFRETILWEQANMSGVETLGSGAFRGTAFDTITIGGTMTEIPEDCFRNALGGSVKVGNNVKKIGHRAFMGCELTDGSFNLGNVEHLGGEVFKDSKIELGTLPAFKAVGGGSFQNSLIRNVNFRNASGNVPLYCFSGCKHISDVTLGDNIKSIDESAFEHSTVSSINLTNIQVFGKRCLNYTGITSVNAPEAIKIGQYAFGNLKLNSVKFGKKITEINAEAFRGCTCSHFPLDGSNITYVSQQYITFTQPIVFSSQYKAIHYYGLYGCKFPSMCRFRGEGVRFHERSLDNSGDVRIDHLPSLDSSGYISNRAYLPVGTEIPEEYKKFEWLRVASE